MKVVKSFRLRARSSSLCFACNYTHPETPETAVNFTEKHEAFHYIVTTPILKLYDVFLLYTNLGD